MLQQTTVLFLKNLKKNNKKEWFDINRGKYESAKKDVENLSAEIIKRLSTIDESIAHLQPKDCMFRINRDVRFSKDKSPYKTNMGVYFSKGGKKGNTAGYYFHLEPGQCFVGGGIYQPGPEELKKVRQEIDYNFKDFTKIIGSKKFKSFYKDLDKSDEFRLSRVPKGYEPDNPAAEYLKLKSYIAFVKLSDADLTSKTLVKKTADAFATLQPLLDFVNESLV